MRESFDEFDSNRDGKITLVEIFGRMGSNQGRDADHARSIVYQMDVNGDNFVDWEEYSQFFIKLGRGREQRQQAPSGSDNP